jgi:hypothetical protein
MLMRLQVMLGTPTNLTALGLLNVTHNLQKHIKIIRIKQPSTFCDAVFCDFLATFRVTN